MVAQLPQFINYLINSPTVIDASMLTGTGPYVAGSAHGVNFNSIADTRINLNLSTTNWIFESILIQNTGTTASLTVAQFGLFSATGGGGTALIAGGTAMSALTSNTVNTPVNVTSQIINSGAWNFTTLYFRITTPQGAAASGNVYINIRPLP